MGRAFDGAANIRVDQSQVFGAAGQTFTVTGNIASSSQPFRVMLAYTDAPGATSGNAWVNDLDLEVTVNGTLFRGNVFSGSGSVTGGVADTRNNTEAVFLPAGTTGSFSITVRATGVNGDGVPGNADTTDQDFALFIYNGTQSAPSPDFTIAATPASQTVTQGGSTSYTATVTSVNGFSSATTLSVSGLPSGASGSFGTNPVTPPAGGSASSTLTVTTAGTTPAGTYPLTITGTSGALSHNTGVTLVVQATGGGNQVQTFSASPGLAIPDNNTTGITSTINVAGSMTITSVSVFTNITHTYQGDLEVSLIGPDNTTVILHNRTGAGTDNIITTYNITTRSNQALTAFNGKNTSGAWKLKVRDLAAVDVGTLNSWKVTFNGYYTASPALAIPDNNTTGVTSTINVAATGTVADLRVRVNITHTYQGDLEVSLIGPDNTTVILHNRTGAGTDNIVTVYPDLTAPAQSLAAFNGKAIAGAWKLKVRDLAAVDVGTLNSWEIDFRAP
jgi:subtilisin-like proprotein convertase family protein